MRRLKILTWNVRGSYLLYLSRVPFDFYVPVKVGRPPGYAGRTTNYVWPENVIEIPAETVKAMDFDLILFQSHDNYLGSPLSAIGGIESGSQNVYVNQVSRHLARLGWEVDIFTRRDREGIEETAWVEEGVRVVHVSAGPACDVRKEDLSRFVPEFTENMVRFMRWQRGGYDLLHANFWMSGHIACEVKRRFGIPFVTTFPGLGRVRPLHQGIFDEFPDSRFAIENRIVQESDHLIAECPQDFDDLTRMKIAIEEGVGGAVTFVGRRSREHLKYYYSAADLFVTTPWYETFGITPIEAMACGVPVIAIRVGGLLLDHELRARFGARGYQRVQSRFRWEIVEAETSRLYERVLGRGSHSKSRKQKTAELTFS